MLDIARLDGLYSKRDTETRVGPTETVLLAPV